MFCILNNIHSSIYWLNSMVFDLWHVARLEVKVDKLTEKLAKDEEKLDDMLSEMVNYSLIK